MCALALLTNRFANDKNPIPITANKRRLNACGGIIIQLAMPANTKPNHNNCRLYNRSRSLRNGK